MGRRKKPPHWNYPVARVRLRVKEVRFENGTVWKVHNRDEENRLTQMYNHIVAMDNHFEGKDIFWAIIGFSSPLEGYIGYEQQEKCFVPIEEIPAILYYKFEEALKED